MAMPTVLHSVLVAAAGEVADVTLAEGRIARIETVKAAPSGVLLPLLADAHVHLDKTFTQARVEGEVNSLFDAIELMERDKENWTPADIRKRAERALARAYRHGTGFMRSHVDWAGPEAPAAWRVLNELKGEWKGRIELELAALAPLDLFADHGEAIAAEVARSGGVLGAFVYRNEALTEKIARVFALADRHDLELDFHVDEGLEVEANGLEAIIAETRRRRFAGRVLCGHACSLSLSAPDERRRILDAGAEAGIGLVILPSTNLYLQDRDTHLAPRLRGIAPAKEARAAGIEVMFASDNCRDPFYPHGDYDLLDIFRLAVLACHLDEDAWLDSIAGIPRRWAGAAAADWAPGAPADFVLVAAEGIADLVARPSAQRTVYRAGRRVEEKAPELEFDHG